MLPVPAGSSSQRVVGPMAVPGSRSRSRLVLVVSNDASHRERLRHQLMGLRWQVLEAPGGAEAWIQAQSVGQSAGAPAILPSGLAPGQLEAMIVDSWLPDQDVAEFLREFGRDYPLVEVLMTDGTAPSEGPRSPYRQELLYALRRCQDGDSAPWQTAPKLEEGRDVAALPGLVEQQVGPDRAQVSAEIQPSRDLGSGHGAWSREPRTFLAEPADERSSDRLSDRPSDRPGEPRLGPAIRTPVPCERLPTLIGSSAAMLEVSRRVRLVATRSTPVLIEGPTGSGKELVAEALHRLSERARKPLVAINCAAIPEALLEAELFGHTRGAFTGAVQGRTGRIEAADGGTLFLDEIGEMPLALQSKLLRFFESGELQRIGDNETIRVDARIVAATHQPLAEHAQKGHFRADLYYRLAVFLIRTPSLVEHMEDLSQLVAHFLEKMGRHSPVKRLQGGAMAKLAGHSWPGNVRELEHVLERAAILAGEDPVITAAEIDFGMYLAN